jgi:hypothetical protein
MSYRPARGAVLQAAILSSAIGLTACGKDEGSTPGPTLLLNYSRRSQTASIQIQVIDDQGGARCANLMQSVPNRPVTKADIDFLRSLFSPAAVSAYRSDLDPTATGARHVGYASAPSAYVFIFKDGALRTETQTLIDSLESFAATKCP